MLTGGGVSLLAVILSPNKIKLLKCVSSVPNRSFCCHLQERRRSTRRGHGAPVPYSVPTALCDTRRWTQPHHLLSQLTAQPVSIPEHWTTAQLLQEVAPGHCQEEVQGWASLPTPCPALCPSLVQGVQFAEKHSTVMLGTDFVQRPQRSWNTWYRHSFTRQMIQLNKVNQQWGRGWENYIDCNVYKHSSPCNSVMNW